MKTGDTVCYTRPWLQSATGGDPTSELWFRQGVVVDINGRLAEVKWEIDANATRVLLSNICKPGSNQANFADQVGWTGYSIAGGKGRNPFKKDP